VMVLFMIMCFIGVVLYFTVRRGKVVKEEGRVRYARPGIPLQRIIEEEEGREK